MRAFLAQGSLVVLVGFVPIDDLPEGADVVRTAILVVKVVGVLPDVESDDGSASAIANTLHYRGVLVSC